MTAPGQAPKVITKRFLDEKQGLATGQPGIEVDDSLFLFVMCFLDEKRFQAPRPDLLKNTRSVRYSSLCRHPELAPRGLE